MQMLIQMNSAIINKFEETNRKFEEKMLNRLEENNQKLKNRNGSEHGENSIMQEKIDEKWEKNYVEFDCKMVEITEQVDNNSGHINDNCKDLKEQSKEILDDVEEKTKIVNKMIMNYKEEEYRNF
ncbi:hypothetical protein FQA39_LY02327 [Lamprigera yunnana]|nr:hypothetical protein FQA39_LY02327 [Lamprigera yunnana]